MTKLEGILGDLEEQLEASNQRCEELEAALEAGAGAGAGSASAGAAKYAKLKVRLFLFLLVSFIRADY